MHTVLVVDDSAVDRRRAGGLIEKASDLNVEYAEDGLQALSRMNESAPDLVVSDMQMPKMDGLKLVKAIGLHHSNVPVILMTAHGSEQIAVAALEEGAASYVPKSQLADRLVDTVHQVLGRTQADRGYDRLIQCSTHTEFTFLLESDTALIDPLVDLVQQIVSSMGICSTSESLRVGVALEQALLNAFFHGNLELSYEQLQESRESLLLGGAGNLVEQRLAESPYRDRRTHVNVEISRDDARFVIRDEGKGFDVQSVRQPADPAAMVQEGGRGLVLMKTFMDEVQYSDTGNEVTLVKRLQKRGPSA